MLSVRLVEKKQKQGTWTLHHPPHQFSSSLARRFHGNCMYANVLALPPGHENSETPHVLYFALKKWKEKANRKVEKKRWVYIVCPGGEPCVRAVRGSRRDRRPLSYMCMNMNVTHAARCANLGTWMKDWWHVAVQLVPTRKQASRRWHACAAGGVVQYTNPNDNRTQPWGTRKKEIPLYKYICFQCSSEFTMLRQNAIACEIMGRIIWISIKH